MDEPYLSQFTQLIRQGAGARDIHDSTGLGSYDSEPSSSAVSERFMARELGRVDVHARNLCATLLDHVGTAARVLDVGCGTGGTTVALALSGLGAEQVIGVDASASTIEAACVRARSHGLSYDHVRFEHVPAGSLLPFQDGWFDLVTCVSVLEFIGHEDARRGFVSEFLRVLRPGGHLFLATPNPFRLHEYHSHRPLGDWRRTPGFPWSSPPWSLHRMFGRSDVVPLAAYRARRHPGLRPLAWAAPVLQWAFPWQQYLIRKPERAAGEFQG